VKSWLDIVDALYEGSWNQDLQRFRSPFAFRGLGRSDLGLASTLVRLASGRADARRLEQALLRNFRKYGHSEGSAADSIWNWLALGQHRGLPTRLLDWTYSPLVALHFATDDLSQFDRDGAIWCVNFVEANKRIPKRLQRLLAAEASDTFTVEMLERFPSLRDFDMLAREPFVVFVEPPAIDSRILHQLALFSLISDPGANLDEWMERHPELCRTVTVPAHLKWEIRDKLDQANVNERVLFPGLDGLSRWLARYYTPAAEARRGQDAIALADRKSQAARREPAGAVAAARQQGPGPRRVAQRRRDSR
jgi:FRG domain